jgi:hypothetical protein
MLSLRLRSVAKEDEFLAGRMRSLTRVDDSLHKYFGIKNETVAEDDEVSR